MNEETTTEKKGNPISRFFWTNKRRRAKNLYFILAVLVVVFALGIGYVNAKLSKIQYEDPNQQNPGSSFTDEIYEDEEIDIMNSINTAGSLNDYLFKWANNGGTLYSSKNVINVLLIGLDSADALENGGRSDTLILLSLNKKTKKINMTSFFRDTWTYINVRGRDMYGKINSSYFYGGPETLIETIQNDFKVKIDYYVAVDFSSEWYNRQLATLTRTTVIVALLSLLVGGGIVTAIRSRSLRKIGSIQGQLNEMAASLMHEMGKATATEESGQGVSDQQGDDVSMDALEKQIQSMQSELRTQIAQVHGQAHLDGLTGVKSKHAYLEMEKTLDERLGKGTLSELAIVVCDVNGLKMINDTRGHQAGDEYIRMACRMICDVFSHSPVYRVGGDEFVVILTGRDYENRIALMRELHQLSAAHI